MSTTTKFTPTPPDASALELRVIPGGHPRQFRIENGPGSLGGEFDRYYVALSGYCGEHKPEVFAAAPELYEALEAAHHALNKYEWYNNPKSGWASDDCKTVRQMVDAALAKVEAPRG